MPEGLPWLQWPQREMRPSPRTWLWALLGSSCVLSLVSMVLLVLRAGAPCLHEAPENIPFVKRTGSSSSGVSLFSGALQRGRGCSSFGAGWG